MFANPLGLLSLLAIPAILAIHFLQRKSITLPVSTLFLLERTQREATSGRHFERLIPSVPLWMQLLAVLLLAWLLSEPRFKKENSVQRVAIVVDASASMTVFKKEAVAALKEMVPKLQGRATALELTLMPSTPGADRLYAGSSVEELLAALEGFTPDGGLLDPSYSLRLARSIVSKDGIVIFLTDTPAEALPYDSQLVSVGKPLGNVGFTGISFAEKEGALTWQAIIRNYGAETTKRSWSLKTKTTATEPREFEIGAKSFVTIQAAFPVDAVDVRIALSPDDFTIDDTLPVIAPRPKALELYTASSAAFRGLTVKAAATDASGKSVSAPPSGRAPSLPGFLTVTQGETSLLQAAVHFADTREADLSACAPTETEPLPNIATLELHTAPDPFTRIWMLVLLAALLVAWHFTAPKERAIIGA